MTIPEEILSLLSGSPELHAYLLARPEQLQTTDYADIITGAPIALTEKGRLLERLSEHMTHSEDAGLIRDSSACLHMALQALESKDAAFSAELWKDGEQLDGPYIAFSMEEARRAIAQYRKHWEENPKRTCSTSQIVHFLHPKHLVFCFGDFRYAFHFDKQLYKLRKHCFCLLIEV